MANGGTAGPRANYLFSGLASGDFQRVTSGPQVTLSSASTASAWMDLDNDGYLDLFVGRTGMPNRIFMNQHDGTFRVEVLPDEGATWGVSAADIDDDGDLDFYAANLGYDNYLYCNDQEGDFTPLTGAVLGDAERSVSASWGDIDNDGDPDLFVANLFDRNRLWINQGGGNFEEVTTGLVVTEVQNSKGSCFGDIDNDADLDLTLSQ